MKPLKLTLFVSLALSLSACVIAVPVPVFGPESDSKPSAQQTPAKPKSGTKSEKEPADSASKPPIVK